MASPLPLEPLVISHVSPAPLRGVLIDVYTRISSHSIISSVHEQTSYFRLDQLEIDRLLCQGYLF